jgi:DNA-binding IclR family transcriptional regulator
MSYYRDRLDTYYDVEEKNFALRILDVLSMSKEAMSFNDLFNLVKSQIITEDREGARNVLTKLRRDHYVAQNNQGNYTFRFPLIQRSWRLQRGL